MSKQSAAKSVPEPHGTQVLKASLALLEQARQAVNDALQNTARAAVAMPYEELSSFGDTSLRKLLKEVAKAGDKEAVLAVVRAFKNTDHIDLNQEDAHNVMGIGYGLPVTAFVSDGKNTNLTALLIIAIKKVPDDDGICAALRQLVLAKVKTNPLLNAVLRSDLNLTEKMNAADLSDEDVRVDETTLEALGKQLLRHIDNSNYNSDVVHDNVRRVMNLFTRFGKNGDDLVRTVSSYRECLYAALMAKAVPESFGTACDEVLRSGSPEAIATFWQAHSARCDKKVFMEKLTEALRPDPAALAAAILDKGNSGYGRRSYPMIHPMMHPSFMMGPFGRW